MSEMAKFVPRSVVVYMCLITALTLGNLISAFGIYVLYRELHDLRHEWLDISRQNVEGIKEALEPLRPERKE